MDQQRRYEVNRNKWMCRIELAIYSCFTIYAVTVMIKTHDSSLIAPIVAILFVSLIFFCICSAYHELRDVQISASFTDDQIVDLMIKNEHLRCKCEYLEEAIRKLLKNQDDKKVKESLNEYRKKNNIPGIDGTQD